MQATLETVTKPRVGCITLFTWEVTFAESHIAATFLPKNMKATKNWQKWSKSHIGHLSFGKNVVSTKKLAKSSRVTEIISAANHSGVFPPPRDVGKVYIIFVTNHRLFEILPIFSGLQIVPNEICRKWDSSQMWLATIWLAPTTLNF